jgi:hypothetical protein
LLVGWLNEQRSKEEALAALVRVGDKGERGTRRASASGVGLKGREREGRKPGTCCLSRALRASFTAGMSWDAAVLAGCAGWLCWLAVLAGCAGCMCAVYVCWGWQAVELDGTNNDLLFHDDGGFG